MTTNSSVKCKSKLRELLKKYDNNYKTERNNKLTTKLERPNLSKPLKRLSRKSLNNKLWSTYYKFQVKESHVKPVFEEKFLNKTKNGNFYSATNSISSKIENNESKVKLKSSNYFLLKTDPPVFNSSAPFVIQRKSKLYPEVKQKESKPIEYMKCNNNTILDFTLNVNKHFKLSYPLTSSNKTINKRVLETELDKKFHNTKYSSGDGKTLLKPLSTLKNNTIKLGLQKLSEMNLDLKKGCHLINYNQKNKIYRSPTEEFLKSISCNHVINASPISNTKSKAMLNVNNNPLTIDAGDTPLSPVLGLKKFPISFNNDNKTIKNINQESHSEHINSSMFTDLEQPLSPKQISKICKENIFKRCETMTYLSLNNNDDTKDCGKTIDPPSQSVSTNNFFTTNTFFNKPKSDLLSKTTWRFPPIEEKCNVNSIIKKIKSFSKTEQLHFHNQMKTRKTKVLNANNYNNLLQNKVNNEKNSQNQNTLECKKGRTIPCISNRENDQISFLEITNRNTCSEGMGNNLLTSSDKVLNIVSSPNITNVLESTSPILEFKEDNKFTSNMLINTTRFLNNQPAAEQINANEVMGSRGSFKRKGKNMNEVSNFGCSKLSTQYCKLSTNCNVNEEKKPLKSENHLPLNTSDKIETFCENSYSPPKNFANLETDHLLINVHQEVKQFSSASFPDSNDCIQFNLPSNATSKVQQHINGCIMCMDKGRINTLVNKSLYTITKKVKKETSVKKNLFLEYQNDNHKKTLTNYCSNHVEEFHDLSGIEQLNDSDIGKEKGSSTENPQCHTQSWEDYTEHFKSDVGFVIEDSDEENVENTNSDFNFPHIENEVSEILDESFDRASPLSESNFNNKLQNSHLSENKRSPQFNVKCATPPTTEISEVTYPSSYPLLSNFPKGKELNYENIDSASKSRRLKVKKGSLVERLQRLVRAKQAEVNMFHHEESLHQPSRVCTLQVELAVKTCSRLMLRCHYISNHSTYTRYTVSEDLCGEEEVDPEVRLYVDPIYAKNIVTGCTILVYPPWCSVWAENRGIMILYCATKLHVIRCPSDNPPPPRSAAMTGGTLLHHFACHYQEDLCNCQPQLMKELFNQREGVSLQQSPADGSVMAALASGNYPQSVQLRLTILHFYHLRNIKNEVLPGVLCLDSNNNVCQLNLQHPKDETKLENVIKDTKSSTMVINNLTVSKVVNINRCCGLRSMLTQLYSGSIDQELMYVVTPSSYDWNVYPLPAIHGSSYLSKECLDLQNIQEVEYEIRVNAKVQVLAHREDILYVCDQERDTIHRIKIASSAVIPTFATQSVIQIHCLCYLAGNLTYDKFSLVTVVEIGNGDLPLHVAPLSFHSAEGDLVFLDGVVTRANSGVALRWEGDCGHSLLKPLFSSQYYCSTCRKYVENYRQRLSLEVCVDSHLHSSIRLKVKSDTAQVFLLGSTGVVSTSTSYNMISMIGASLKCLAVVLEVLKNPFGDVLEFLLEEV